MRSAQDYNAINWLNNYFANQEQINEHDLSSVLYFSLMWNMFESLACGRNASIRVMEGKVNDLHADDKLRPEDFAEYVTYFQNRYLDNGVFNERFERLRLRPGDRRDLVESVLTGQTKAINEVVLALLIIVYRFRNNLFHGEKDIYKLQYQIDNFKTANRLLATFLDLLK